MPTATLKPAFEPSLIEALSKTNKTGPISNIEFQIISLQKSALILCY
jgi:hypothetical protein